MHGPLQRFRNWRWWTVTLRGIAAILFGVLALARPGAALFSLVILFGIYAIADGVLAFALGASPLVPAPAMYGRGIVSIIAGVLALLMPGVTGLVLVLLIGAWAIAAGILEIVMAIRMRHQVEGEWFLGVEGVLSIVFGVVLCASPLLGAIVLALWIGAFALVVGGMMVVTGLRMRSFDRTHAEPLAGAAA